MDYKFCVWLFLCLFSSFIGVSIALGDRTYAVLDNIDCAQNVIQSANVSNTECEAMCDNNRACVAYVVHNDSIRMECNLTDSCVIDINNLPLFPGKVTYKKECASGTFGSYETSCTGQCSGNCRDGDVCNTASGVCDRGCNPGYSYTSDQLCTQECDYGSYGYNCDACPSSCNNTCDKFSAAAVCIGGCTSGYQGADCMTECAGNTYGYGCANCPVSCNSGCEKFSTEAVCIGGCQPGYHTDCQTECEDNNYGYNCDECPVECANSCDKFAIEAECSGGCKAGFQGTDCQTTCSDNTYGENCAQSCGYCLNGQSCHPITGHCPNALCHPGYHTLLCDKRCDGGRFGFDCTQVCDCPATSCHHISGCPESPTPDSIKITDVIATTALVLAILSAVGNCVVIVLAVILHRCVLMSTENISEEDGIIDQHKQTSEYYNLHRHINAQREADINIGPSSEYYNVPRDPNTSSLDSHKMSTQEQQIDVNTDKSNETCEYYNNPQDHHDQPSVQQPPTDVHNDEPKDTGEYCSMSYDLGAVSPSPSEYQQLANINKTNK